MKLQKTIYIFRILTSTSPKKHVFLIGIRSMQGLRATGRHKEKRRRRKDKKHVGQLFRGDKDKNVY